MSQAGEVAIPAIVECAAVCSGTKELAAILKPALWRRGVAGLEVDPDRLRPVLLLRGGAGRPEEVADREATARVLSGEQSNTSIIVETHRGGRPLIIKLFLCISVTDICAGLEFEV